MIHGCHVRVYDLPRASVATARFLANRELRAKGTAARTERQPDQGTRSPETPCLPASLADVAQKCLNSHTKRAVAEALIQSVEARCAQEKRRGAM